MGDKYTNIPGLRSAPVRKPKPGTRRVVQGSGPTSADPKYRSPTAGLGRVARPAPPPAVNPSRSGPDVRSTGGSTVNIGPAGRQYREALE
jgi:hypothetical protein